MADKEPLSVDIDHTKGKSEFGIEKDPRSDAASTLGQAIAKTLKPKGVLADKKEHTAIVLSKNLSGGKEGYHLYVPMVHQTKDMPLALKSAASPLKGKDKTNAYNVEVLSNFNDGTSYMDSDVGELKEGDAVIITYSDVVGGIPSKGRVKKKKNQALTADQATKLFQEGAINPGGGPFGSSVGSSAASNLKRTSGTTPSPVKITKQKLLARNKKIQKSKESPCRSIYQNRRDLAKYNNYEGDMRVFKSKCDDFQSMMKQMQQTINSGVAKSLLDKNGLGDNFKRIMLEVFVGGPYLYQGKAEFTGEYVYGSGFARNSQGQKNARALAGGYTMKGYGAYSEYWKQQGNLKEHPPLGWRMTGAFDCLALTVYLALKSGFLANVLERDLQKTNSNCCGPGDTYRHTQAFQLGIEQWAATPGANGNYLNPYGHQFTSAGDGAKLLTSGKGKGWYAVNYFNAGGHSQKNAYKRGPRQAMWLKYEGGTGPGNIIRYGSKGNRKVRLQLMWSHAYADYTGDFDKMPSTPPAAPPQKRYPPGDCRDHRGRPYDKGGCYRPGTDPAPSDLYPLAQWIPAADDTKRGSLNPSSVRNIVFHTTGGSGTDYGAIKWFQYAERSSKTSTHFVINYNGQVTQMHDLNTLTIHAARNNSTSIGIEHVGPGRAARAGGPHPGPPKDTPNAAWWAGTDGTRMLEASAKLVAWLCDKYNIPRQRAMGIRSMRPATKGIVLHREISGRGGHHDPGPYFPWDRYIQMVKNA